ncbi:hypothetical protein, partial [Klebsiella pneumoniae]|uniref:hypothetical protein n=1 Tax=Klebsiella pneumoniae TaxID=573 RepID=UPI001C7E1094
AAIARFLYLTHFSISVKFLSIKFPTLFYCQRTAFIANSFTDCPLCRIIPLDYLFYLLFHAAYIYAADFIMKQL